MTEAINEAASLSPDYMIPIDKIDSTIDKELFDKINALELEPIRYNLVTRESGWYEELALRIEQEYKQYIYLSDVYGGKVPVVPSKLIDEFWHYHILDSLKYFEDCMNTVGYYLHHFPYFGSRSISDKATLKAASRASKALFAAVFGNEPFKMNPNQPAHCCWSRTGCDEMKLNTMMTDRPGFDGKVIEQVISRYKVIKKD